MKNSASNPFKIQALQRQAKQLLPELTAIFSQLNYSEIIHQRINRQNIHQTQHQQPEVNFYQGLTKAQHMQFGCVMIKWQLGLEINNRLSDFSYEFTILNNLNVSQYALKKATPLVPTILDYQALNITVLKQNQQLIIIVMPFYSLGSLSYQLSDKRYNLLDNNQKQRFIVQAAHLINNLHQQGWLHNDIKPSNILLNSFLSNSADNSIKSSNLLLTDFALAQRLDNNLKQNCIMNVTGTPAYLAPERWQGQGATQQSDIYALGIMMFEILTGKRPFKIASQSNETLRNWALEHCQSQIPILPLDYQGYQSIINKALAKRVEKRYQSMRDVLEELKNTTFI